MITPERAARYKKQALKSLSAKALNPKTAGVATVPVSPHDLLDLLLSFEEYLSNHQAAGD